MENRWIHPLHRQVGLVDLILRHVEEEEEEDRERRVRNGRKVIGVGEIERVNESVNVNVIGIAIREMAVERVGLRGGVVENARGTEGAIETRTRINRGIKFGRGVSILLILRRDGEEIEMIGNGDTIEGIKTRSETGRTEIEENVRVERRSLREVRGTIEEEETGTTERAVVEGHPIVTTEIAVLQVEEEMTAVDLVRLRGGTRRTNQFVDLTRLPQLGERGRPRRGRKLRGRRRRNVNARVIDCARNNVRRRRKTNETRKIAATRRGGGVRVVEKNLQVFPLSPVSSAVCG
jgi:hypothetical protein